MKANNLLPGCRTRFALVSPPTLPAGFPTSTFQLTVPGNVSCPRSWGALISHEDFSYHAGITLNGQTGGAGWRAGVDAGIPGSRFQDDGVTGGMKTFCVRMSGSVLAGVMAIALAGSAAGQSPMFSEMQPVYHEATATWGHFPALTDMRSAWGDIDGDGDLDVIVMGKGPTGPVTKLFINESSALNPILFVERLTSLPNLQDGALALGDMDNDGDLDVAITGSTVPTPTNATQLRAHIYRNSGPLASGGVNFTQVSLGAWFTPCYRGTVSWGDMDNDGDLDLFVSGLSWNSDLELPNQKVCRIYRQDLDLQNQKSFTPHGPVFRLYPDGVFSPEPADQLLIRRVEWVDMNRDGFQDLVLIGDIDADRRQALTVTAAYAQEIWMNGQGANGFPGDFGRLGSQVVSAAIRDYETGTDLPSWIPDRPPHAFFLGSSGWAGGVGDWDGDGMVDLYFPGFLYHEFTGPWGNVYDQFGGISPPNALLPGFEKKTAPLFPGTYAQIAMDLTASGKQGWLGSASSLLPESNSAFGPPDLSYLVGDGQGSLTVAFGLHLGIRARFRGVLDAVDLNGDGRLDVLHSGFDDGATPTLAEPATRFYRNDLAAPNTRPAPPTGLTADATSLSVNFNWLPGSDAETPPAALRYAIKLRRGSVEYFIRPPATIGNGQRAAPGLEQTLNSTTFLFNALNGGSGAALPAGTYHWSVQSIDSGGLASVFAAEQEFILPDPPEDTGERHADLPYRDSAIDLGDVDGDGDLDVALAGRPVSTGGTIIRVNGGPDPGNANEFLFSAFGPDLPQVLFGAVRWGDVDGDGDVDLALSGRSGGQPLTRIYRNHNGALELRNVLDGVEGSALDWGDFDNDGDLDLVVTGYRDNKPLTRLYRNGGESNQVPHALIMQETTLPNIGSGAAAWADFDHDGDLDLLLCGDTADYSLPPVPCNAPPFHLRPPGTIYLCGNGVPRLPQPQTLLLRNDGLATNGIFAGKWRFTPVPTDLPPVFSYTGGRAMTARAEWADMTGDGYPDLALGGMTTTAGQTAYVWPTAKIHRNAGPGIVPGEWRFLAGNELLNGVLDGALQTLAIAEWTREGGPDVLFGGWINGPGTVPIQVRSGNGGGNFLPLPNEPFLPFLDDMNAPQFPGGLAAFGHLDGDANVDIVMAGRHGIQGSGGLGSAPTAGRIFLANSLPANLRPTVPTNPTATVSGGGTEVTFTWGPSSDGIQLVQPTYNLHVERVDGMPGGMPGMADGLTGRRRISRRGNVGHHLSWTLRNLPAGEYRWRVQAIDAALATSEFVHAPQTFTVAAPLVAVIHPLAPFHNWQPVHPRGASVDWFAVAAGRSARLVVGRRGQVFLSRRSGVFEVVESGAFTDLRGALIDSDGAMIVGDDGVIRISSDAVVWSESTSGTTASLRAVVRGDAGWVAAGDGVILRSTDRRNWTPGTMPANTLVHGLAARPGRYVAVGERAGQKVLLTSTDGLAWTEVTPGGLAPGALFSVATDGTKFVAVGGRANYPGTHRATLTSTDGQTWSSTQVNDYAPLLSVARGTSGWLAVSEQERFFSLEAATWQALTTPLPLDNSFGIRLRAIAAADGLVTIVGAAGQIFDAPDSLAAWMHRGGSRYYTYDSPTYLAANGNRVVAVTSYNVQPVSDDGGATWWSGPYYGNNLDGVAFGQGRFVRSGGAGLQYSPDGGIWTNETSTPYSSYVIFGDGIFLATRNNFLGGFYRSTTGRDWTIVSDGIPPSVGLARGLGMFLALDGSGQVRISANGTSWSAPVNTGAQRLCFAHDRFFVLYDNGDVRSSTDGLTWTPVNGLGVFGSVVLQQIIWHDNHFVAVGGPDAVLMISPDMVTWTRIPIPTSGQLYSALSTPAGLVVAGTEQALIFAPYVQSAPPPAPLALGTPRQPAAGQLAFTVTGPPGQVVTLERSENLQDWTPVQTFTLSGGAETLEVELPALPLNAFYRLSAPSP